MEIKLLIQNNLWELDYIEKLKVFIEEHRAKMDKMQRQINDAHAEISEARMRIRENDAKILKHRIIINY